jgi:hypothetical protein
METCLPQSEGEMMNETTIKQVYLNIHNDTLKSVSKRVVPDDFSAEITLLLEGRIVQIRMTFEQLRHFQCELLDLKNEQMDGLLHLLGRIPQKGFAGKPQPGEPPYEKPTNRH